jgi:hypothetical protein
MGNGQRVAWAVAGCRRLLFFFLWCVSCFCLFLCSGVVSAGWCRGRRFSVCPDHAVVLSIAAHLGPGFREPACLRSSWAVTMICSLGHMQVTDPPVGGRTARTVVVPVGQGVINQPASTHSVLFA